MNAVVAYNTPAQFLEATKSVLEQKELENNLILGLCNNFEDKAKVYEGCVFVNVFENNQIVATSIRTKVKAIVSGNTKSAVHLKLLADYYLDNKIDLVGAVGEKFYAREFSKAYRKEILGEKGLIVHQLNAVINLAAASGDFSAADGNDTGLIATWIRNFEVDGRIFPPQSKEQAFDSAETKIRNGDLFKWVDKNEVVSMAAIMRRTKNIGIVGLVYTPDKFRGKGYATSCVQKLSEYLLENGSRYCGLFTDKANPTSNHIYQKIGYVPGPEFVEIKYGNSIKQ